MRRSLPCTRLAASWLLLATLASCVSTPAVVTTPAVIALQRIAVDARPNGIAIRPTDGAVFIADDVSNTVLSSSDGKLFARYAALPVVAGQPNSVSQLAFANSGVLLVARFGFGTTGTVFEIPAIDTTRALAGLDPTRRRLGLAVVGPGQFLSTWFVKNEGHPAQGGLSLITYDAASGKAQERDVMSGLGKPIGVAVLGDQVFVSDQADNTIVGASLAALLRSTQAIAPTDIVARVNDPDLMAVDENATLHTKCDTHSVCQIASNGAVTILAGDFHDARGVAIDPTRHLLYVVDRAAAGRTSYERMYRLK